MLCIYIFTAILNPHTLQRPNVMQSSPSPTSIITNINQSNYLCSQTPDPQPASSPQNCKDSNVFQRPCNNTPRREAKHSQFRQVVIVQTQNTSVAQDADPEHADARAQPPRNYITKGQLSVPFKINQQKIDSVQEQTKQENYNFKNLAINNYIQDYSNKPEYQNQQRGEVFQQDVKGFDFIKPKFYLSYSESNGIVQNECSHNNKSQNEFNKETKIEPNKEKTDSISMSTDAPYENCVENKSAKLADYDSITKD